MPQRIEHNISLITVNCARHFATDVYSGLRVQFFPRKCPAKYQTLTLGLVAQSQIRYTDILPPLLIKNTVKCQSGEHQFPATTRNRQYVIGDGYLLHPGDATEMFNEVRALRKHSTIIK